MNDRRTFIGAIIAFCLGLVLGQQEHSPQALRTNADLLKAEKPGKIKIICRPSSIRCDFPLEAVGLDADGQVKPLNELRDPI